jgi:mono/diheme cytochrome c family protein
MIHIRQLLLVVAVLALVLAVAAPAQAQNPAETVYKAKCAMCHGPDGKGSPTGIKMGAHDFTSADVQKQTDAQLSDAIAKGKNKMPGYEKSLKPEQIKDLVAYIRALAKKK